jgi:hypothetical protein
MSDENLKDQLARLPLRAIVAFAARCASRVRPLADDLPEDYRAVIDRAISIAEAVAQGDSTAKAAETAVAAAKAIKPVKTDRPSALAAETATLAALVAGSVALTTKGVTEAGRAETAARIETAARVAAKAALTARAAGDFSGASRVDVERLIALDLGEPAPLGSPIDPSESGPLGRLWPGGAPYWYTDPPKPADAAVGIGHIQLEDAALSGHAIATPPAYDMAPGRLFLETEVSEYADTEEVAEALARLGYALNAYHIARGGNGLVIDDWQILVPSAEPVEVKR